MIEDILNTEVKVKILRYVSGFQDAQFQAVQIANALNLSVSRTSECLNYLADKGILLSKKVGKGSLFGLNKSNYLARIISEMFEKEKKLTDLVAKDYVAMIRKFPGIKSAVIFGSAIRDLKLGSDIDFLIVSENELDRSAVSKIDAELTEKYGFPVSSVLMTEAEFKRKSAEAFVIGVIANGKTIYGKDLEDVLYGKRR